jgi:glutamate racemase
VTLADNRAIGVFDSGVGGLTVLEALHRLLPEESTIYLGDLARCPYGPRPQSEVHGFALEIGDFLAGERIKLLVVACNTATAAAYHSLRDRYPFPVVGVVEPGAREAVRISRSGRIGVVATQGTVVSHAYRDSIHRMKPDALVGEVAASWLVPVIESGVPDPSSVQSRLAAALRELQSQDVDTLILGCTHFPLIRDMFETELGPEVAIVDSAGTTAREVSWLLHELDLDGSQSVEHRVLVTGAAGPFATRAQTMFHSSLEIEAVDLSAHAQPSRLGP